MNDTIAVEEIITANAIDTSWFLPFVIHRLQPFAVNRVVTIDVVLQDIWDEPLMLHPLRLTWHSESEGFVTPPVQDHSITEWAACGLGCVFLPLYTEWGVLQVTQSGDSFDYWVGNDEFEFGMEMSGTLGEDLERRHRRKVQQLRQSRHNVAGYVSVISFQLNRSIFSFHEREER